MKIDLDPKRNRILNTSGHILVTGGPGSGKTTIALAKAHKVIEAGIHNNQEILFLSFSRAAVSRIIDSAEGLLPKEIISGLSIQTFHSFYWSIIQSFGYLLGAPKKLNILLPHDEKTRQVDLALTDKEWKKKLPEIFFNEGLVAFDLFAKLASEIFNQANRIADIYNKKYPLIIVDEAQDTADDQWESLKYLANSSNMLCLADLSQQIYDFIPGVGPKRIKIIEEDLLPTKVNLGLSNFRSPNSEINTFAKDILLDKPRGKSYHGVTFSLFPPQKNQRNKKIRQALGFTFKRLKKKIGRNPESIALLAAFDKGVTVISEALNEKPIRHKVLFDETAVILSSRVIAYFLEPKDSKKQNQQIVNALDLISDVLKVKGTKTSIKRAHKLEEWAKKVISGKSTRAKVVKVLQNILSELSDYDFQGNPAKDWIYLRDLFYETGVNELKAISKNVEYLIHFKRGKRIATNLLEDWHQYGSYKNAREALSSAISEDQILSGADNESGIYVMTIHKSKGKEFDGVIILRDQYLSPFVWKDDPKPFKKSRKLLRVGVTRARYNVHILSSAIYPSCPILDRHNL